MATFKSFISEQEEEKASVDPAVQNENSDNVVEVNIAIVGRDGSGRSNFVNVITGYYILNHDIPTHSSLYTILNMFKKA